MNVRQKMTCAQVAELLSDYCSDDLDAATTARVRWHLLLCRGCRGQLAQLRSTIATLGRITADDIDPTLRERLVAAFRNWR